MPLRHGQTRPTGLEDLAGGAVLVHRWRGVLDVLELLERKVGVDLLDRSAHPVVPAEAGRRFLPDARAAPAAADRAVAGLEAYRRDLHGVLRLGFMSAATGTHTRRILDLVAREAPDVTVQLVQLAWHEQASAVRDRTVDTALVRPPTADDDGLRLDLARLEPRVVALPAGHLLAALVAVPRRAARTVGEG